MQPYTIIIPAYNEGEAIGKVLDDLGLPAGCSEIIVVDDGSSDKTADEAVSRPVRLVSHPVNRGYGASLKTGIKAAQNEFVILFDADGQHRREDLLRIAAQMEQYDMVVGSRDKDSHRPLSRRPGKRILGWFVNMLSNRKIPDANSGLRSFRLSVLKKYLHLMPDGFSFSTTSTVAFNRLGYNVAYVPITVLARAGNKSTVKIFRDGLRTLMLIINLTVLFAPMKVFLPVSFAFMFSGIAYFFIYWATIRIHVTASMTLFFLTGVLIFFLGVVCEQISSLRRERFE